MALAAAVGVVAGSLLMGATGWVGAATTSPDRSLFVPLSPVRILDTRIGLGTAASSTAPLGPGGAINLQVAGAGGVPVGATAVVMNVTYTQATAAGFLTVWPAGQPRPNVSNLNTQPGGTQPNLVTVKLGSGGQVSIFNFAGTTHVIADVAGYYGTTTGSLTLSDLGTQSGFGVQSTTVGSAISLPAGSCKAALTANFGAGSIGRMVVGTLAAANGSAVLPNTAAVIPSIVISTTQGGAVPNVVVCNTGDGPLTVPAGSVFTWRLIDA